MIHTLKGEIIVKSNVERLHFEEESRLIASGSGNITCNDAAAAGRATACEKGAILVSHGSGTGADALAYAFASGVSAAGARCVFAGECCAPAAAYAAKSLGCTAGCHIHTEITASLSLFSGDGLPLYRSYEEKIEKALQSSKELPYSHFGDIRSFGGADELYAAKAASFLRSEPAKVYADVYSSSPSVMRVCGDILSGRGNKNGERIAFRISADGRRISAYSDETGYVFRDKLIMLCCRRLFEQGKDAAVCGKAPRALEKLAGLYGRKILSCGGAVCVNESSPSGRCLAARKAAAQQMFANDGIVLMMTVLDILGEENKTLSEALKGLPDYADINRYIPVDRPSELLKKLCVTGMEESGVIGDGENGRVTIRPVRTGKGVMLCVESCAAETAAELCDFYAGIISNAAKQ